LAEHVFETFFYEHEYKMVQLDLKKHTIYKRKYMCQIMIILCQWDFNGQVK